MKYGDGIKMTDPTILRFVNWCRQIEKSRERERERYFHGIYNAIKTPGFSLVGVDKERVKLDI